MRIHRYIVGPERLGAALDAALSIPHEPANNRPSKALLVPAASIHQDYCNERRSHIYPCSWLVAAWTTYSDVAQASDVVVYEKNE